MAQNNDRKKISLLIFVLCVVNIIVYFPVLKGYFYYDDFQYYLAYQKSNDWLSGAMTSFNQGYNLTFVQDFFYWPRYKFFGLTPTPYFILNILQEMLVVILVFFFAYKLFHSLKIAFYASLVMTIAFPPIQVVTWITGSTITFEAITHLACVIFFLDFLKTHKWYFYGGSFVCFALALFSTVYSVSLLPVLFVIAFLGSKEYRFPRIRAMLSLLPFLCLLLPYIFMQIWFIQRGTSEGAIAGGFRPGIHIFANYYNLVHLIIPDVYFPRLVNLLNASFPAGLIILRLLTPFLAAMGIGISIYILVKGSAWLRILILWVYISFFPFSLWVNPDAAHATRYLYLPMVAFAILLAIGIDWSSDRLKNFLVGNPRIWGIIFLGVWLVYNLIPIYIFEFQEVAKGQVRQTIIQQVTLLHPVFAEGSKIYLGVPDPNYRDLGFGLPVFYKNQIQVTTVPPGVWPSQQAADSFYFQYTNGQVLEKTSP